MLATRTEILAEGVTLHMGDCRDVLPTLPRAGALVTVTDPPYGVLVPGDFSGPVRDDRGGAHGLVRKEYGAYSDTYENFVSEIVPRLNMALDLADRGGVFTGPHIHEQRKPDAIGGVYVAAGTGRNVWGFKNFMPVLLYGAAPDLNLGATVPTAIRSSDIAEKCEHPCPKPTSWMKWLVSLTSRKGETILDPFMGSGTTGCAAVAMGRRFVGIELEPSYFDIARRRISDALARPDLFVDQPARAERPAELFATGRP